MIKKKIINVNTKSSSLLAKSINAILIGQEENRFKYFASLSYCMYARLMFAKMYGKIESDFLERLNKGINKNKVSAKNRKKERKYERDLVIE